MKKYNGKSISSPSGKIDEYNYWECKLHQTYFCFRDTQHAKNVFVDEMFENQDALIKNGLFFQFTYDTLTEITDLVLFAIKMSLINGIPVKILSKQVSYITPDLLEKLTGFETKISFGFTISSNDYIQVGCATNSQLIEAIRILHKRGFRTWARIKPVVNYEASLKTICSISRVCGLFKIGIKDGETYDDRNLLKFMDDVHSVIPLSVPIYWEKSF